MFVTSLLVAATTAVAGAAGPVPRHVVSAPEPHVVTVVAADYHFAMPETLPAGTTTFVVQNHGREPHHVTLIRLEQGKRLADLMRAFKAGGPLPSWAVDVGGPNAVDPGATSLATTVHLAAGRYAVICMIPSADGAPHMMKGMSRELVVTPAAEQASATPRADATITLFDYGFRASRPITSHTERVAVTNAGHQPHELVVVKLAPGKTAHDVAVWAEKMAGPPPAHFLGGVSMIDPGQTNTLTLGLAPGHYAMLCFIPDAKDGKPHVAHGMSHDFEVR